MTDLLAGRAAIVTGAGRGIGRAIAAAMIAQGASVVVADNGTSIAGDGGDPGVARDAAASLGVRAVPFGESVASPGVARQLVDLAIRTFGGIDIIVNNAAIQHQSPIWRADPRDWDAVMRTNLSAPFYLTSAAAAAMREQARSAGRGRPDRGWGRIVNIVHASGLYGNAGQAAVASAKAGLFGLTRVTAMDLAPDGITANAVVPFARTRVTDTFLADDDAARLYKERALGIGVGHVANLVCALCSPVGGSITGQLLGVRGREIFLFNQPRPIATLQAGAPETIAQDLVTSFGDQFADLTTDVEAFNTEPLL